MKILKLLLYFILLCPLLSPAQTWLWGVDAVNSAISGQSDPFFITTDTAHNFIYETGSSIGSPAFGAKTIIGPTHGYIPFLVKYNSSGTAIWATGGNTPTRFCYSYPNCVTVDPSGNPIITGVYLDTLTLGSITLKTGGLFGCAYLAKFDTGGNVLWAQSAIMPLKSSSSEGYAVATDMKGYIYVTGTFTTDSITFGNYKLYGSFFIVKYAPSGTVVWARGTGKKAGIGNALTTDISGNVYVTGSFEDTINFGTDTLKTNPNSSQDEFIVKYDSSGNVLWARCPVVHTYTFYPASGSQGNSITIDNANNVYVAGEFDDSVSFGPYNFYTGNFGNIFIEKFNPNGNLIKTIASSYGLSVNKVPYTNALYSIIANKKNDIYICGNFNDSIQFGSVKLVDFPAANFTFLVKFDTALNALCGTDINDANDERNATTIAVDPLTEDVYVAADGNDSITFGATKLGGINEWAFLAKWQPCLNSTAGITDLKANSEGLIVYPNPFANTTTIALNADGKYYLEVDDLTGRKLKYIEFTGIQYELLAQGLAKGLYFIRVFDNQNIVIGTTKIVVQ